MSIKSCVRRERSVAKREKRLRKRRLSFSSPSCETFRASRNEVPSFARERNPKVSPYPILCFATLHYLILGICWSSSLFDVSGERGRLVDPKEDNSTDRLCECNNDKGEAVQKSQTCNIIYGRSLGLLAAIHFSHSTLDSTDISTRHEPGLHSAEERIR